MFGIEGAHTGESPAPVLGRAESALLARALDGHDGIRGYATLGLLRRALAAYLAEGDLAWGRVAAALLVDLEPGVRAELLGRAARSTPEDRGTA